MLKILQPFIFFILLGNISFSQTTVKGRIIDVTNAKPLKGASILLLDSKDSILIDFTRADDLGQFNFSTKRVGSSLLLITYKKYVDYVYQFELNGEQVIDLAAINLTQPLLLVEEVIIRANKSPIKIIGDTTEYNASSYILEKNAKVEDLLRQLPGLKTLYGLFFIKRNPPKKVCLGRMP